MLAVNYDHLRKNFTREQIESYCRQMLACADREYIEERKKLIEETNTLIEARRRAKAYEDGIDEAPGVIVDAITIVTPVNSGQDSPCNICGCSI